jgi:hypothetical protein
MYNEKNPIKKIPDPIGFAGNFFQIFMEKISVSHKVWKIRSTFQFIV